MKKLLVLVMLFSFAATFGQQAYQVLNWKSEQTVNTYLLQKMQLQYSERKLNLESALTSPSAMKAYRDSCSLRYRRIIGSMPNRTPLNVRQTGVIRQKGYSIEKIIYESVPGHHVTGNLYVPEGNGKFPAVLLMCGHEDEAKATESYQKTAILFALNKYVVLVVDPNSQAERHQLTDASGKPRTRGGTTEHTLINAAANLVGSGTVAYQLWDNVRALDYLESRKEVDKDRIGCLGNSGGGTQTTYLVGFDDRIKVAAVCSYVASRERNFELFGPNDGCQHIPGEGEALLEISDFLVMFSPKPVLILAGEYDFVDFKGTQLAYHELEKVYDTFDASEKVRLVAIEDGHGISKPKREAAVTWFNTWMYNNPAAVNEPALTALSKEVLTCTGQAQVNASFPNELNDIERSRIRANAYSKERKSDLDQLQQHIRTVLNLTGDSHSVTSEDVGVIPTENSSIQKRILRRQDAVPLPTLAIYPEGRINEVIIWFHDKGKHKMADSVSWWKQHLSKGRAIVFADISGVGELADPAASNDPKYFNREYRNTMLALHTGTSLPALRTRDIINVMDFVSLDEKTAGVLINVYATGICALPALHAGVLDKRIKRVFLKGNISSFHEIFETPDAKDWYSYVIPDVLKYYDIVDLEKALGERLDTTR